MSLWNMFTFLANWKNLAYLHDDDHNNYTDYTLHLRQSTVRNSVESNWSAKVGLHYITELHASIYNMQFNCNFILHLNNAKAINIYKISLSKKKSSWNYMTWMKAIIEFTRLIEINSKKFKKFKKSNFFIVPSSKKLVFKDSYII